jgi:heat shock protein HslJ
MKTSKILIALTLVLSLTLAACGILQRDPDLQGTAWNLIEINGQPILEGTTPTLFFNDEGVGGNGSCNSFGGDYTQENGQLTIEQIFSTLMYCDDVMDQEFAYFTALQEAAEFQIRNNNLQILNADGQVTLVFAPQN